MSLIGLGTVTLAAFVADLAGSGETRSFTRKAWLLSLPFLAGWNPSPLLDGIVRFAGGIA